MRQGKAIAGDHEGQDDRLAVPAMVPPVAPAGQIVVIELEESPQPVLQVLLDRRRSGPQAIQRAVEPILGDGAVGNTEQLLQPSRGVPVLSQGKLAAGRAKALDDLESHDVGRPHRFLALGQVTVDDRIKPQQLPKPQCQPDLTEAPTVGPADLAQADAYDVRIVGRRDLIVVGEEAELLGVSLAIVHDDGALPAALLIVVELTEVSDDVLPGPCGGTQALDQGLGGVGLAVFGTGGAAPEQTGLPITRMVRGRHEIKELGSKSVFTTTI